MATFKLEEERMIVISTCIHLKKIKNKNEVWKLN